MKSERTYTMSARADAVAGTRERIVAAAQALLLDQAYEDITLTAIAKAAGVSHQTVLNHFESKEGVARAVAVQLGHATTAAREAAVPGDVEGLVHVLVGEYERFGDANARWAVTSERLGGLASILDEARAGHQAWLGRMFEGPLPRTGAARRRAINALHAATDVYTWKLLRRDLDLSRAEAERTICMLVRGVLDQNPTSLNDEKPGSR
jgi:AcrR family transcriptional regulator